MDTRSRELRLQDDLSKAQRSSMALAKDNHRLQTAYNEARSQNPQISKLSISIPQHSKFSDLFGSQQATKASDREITQLKGQYEANLDALGKTLELTQMDQVKNIWVSSRFPRHL